ncbi:hypothetical protein HUW62_12195 [Myxococcus sp. AM011]|uniref:hypothetical protein n=1 Tax=Myxococcus sp. AM011 TaxID=2745200 RepID=UPI001595FAAF|nr:hypothetical protein [Myxococcus sp. AM011]NVJ21980.1 hypothetical protein [Myxococcus sp. AM011]
MSRKPISLLLSFALCVMPVAALAEESWTAQESASVVSSDALVSDEGGEGQQSEDLATLSECYWRTTYCSNAACANGGAVGVHVYDCYDGGTRTERTVSTCCGAVSPQ